jgi:hypothetical protein
MSSQSLFNSFRQSFSEIIQRPSTLLEWVQYFLLGSLLIQVLIGYGGFTGYAAPLVGSLRLFALLSVVHLLWMVFGKRRRASSWELLLPVPWLLLGMGWYFSPMSSTEGSLQLVVALMAYGVYVILCNSLRNTRLLWSVFFIALGVVVLALFAAFFQYYLFPEWMVSLERERPLNFLNGAAGFLIEPLNLAALLLLFLPGVLLIASMPRFSGPVRMLNGFLFLALLVGLILSGNLTTGALILLTSFTAPFFISRHWKYRRRFWGYSLLCVVVFMPLFWFGTVDIRERFVSWTEGSAEQSELASVKVAQSILAESPVMGVGPGRFAYYWEAYRPAEANEKRLYPENSYAGLLMETGMLGLACWLLPLLWIFFKLGKRWYASPYLAVSKDVQSRMDRMGRGHPGRFSLERQHGRAPSAKLLGGSLLFGFILVGIQLWSSAALKLPIVVLYLAILFALAVCLLWPKNGGSRWWNLFSAAVPVLIATWAVPIGLIAALGQSIVYTTNEKLDSVLVDPDGIFMNPTVLNPLMNNYEQVVQLNPRHAEALAGMGLSQMGRIAAEMDPIEEIVADAIPYLEAALSEEPRLWRVRFDLARALLIQGRMDEALNALRQVTLQAPMQPAPNALMGLLLMYVRGEQEAGQALMDTVLEIDAEYEPLLSALRRLELSGNTAEVSQTDIRLWTTQILETEQAPERTLWAGVPATE